MNWKKIIIPLVFTVILFGSILFFIDFSFFLKQLVHVKVNFLISIFFIQILSFFFRALRFELILNKNEKTKFFSISAIHFLINRLLPAKLGEFSLPVLLKRYSNISLTKGVGALFLFRFLDLISVFLLLFISALFVEPIGLQAIYIITVALLAIIFLALLWYKIDLFLKISFFILSKIQFEFIQKIKNKIIKIIEQIKEYRQQQAKGFFLKANILTLLNWFLTYLMYYLFIKAFSLEFSFMEIMFATTISNFMFLLPINSFGNLGTFEIGWAIGFLFIGLSKEESIPLGLFANIYITLIIAILAGIGFLLLKKISKHE